MFPNLKVLSWDLLFSIVSLMIFFYYFIENVKVHNFANDNALTTFAQNVRNLISVLESESNIAIDWFKTNKMIVNDGKFTTRSFNLEKPLIQSVCYWYSLVQ